MRRRKGIITAMVLAVWALFLIRRSEGPSPLTIPIAEKKSETPPSLSVASSNIIPTAPRWPSSKVPYPKGSICGMIARLPLALGNDTHEYDQALLAEMKTLLRSDDPDLDLMQKLLGDDLREIENADRSLGTDTSRKIALLARLGLIDGTNLEKHTMASAEDLQTLEEMKKREPNNGFWPLAEYAVKKRQGIPMTPEEAYSWTRDPNARYDDPIRKLYASIRRRALKNDRAYFAFLSAYSRAPIASFDIYKNVRNEIPISEEDRDPQRDSYGMTANDYVNAVGVAMTESQYDPKTRKALEGYTGDSFIALQGLQISQRATHDPDFDSRTVYQQLMKEFQPAQDEWYALPVYDWAHPDNCDEKGFHGVVAKIREKVKEVGKVASSSESSLPRLQRE